LRIADCGLKRISERRLHSAWALAIGNWLLKSRKEDVLRNPQSAIRNPQSAINAPSDAFVDKPVAP